MDERHTGKVVWFSAQKGMGFISWVKDGVAQTDMFVHFSDIASEGFKTLKKDQAVSFTIGKNNKGQPKATDVQVTK